MAGRGVTAAAVIVGASVLASTTPARAAMAYVADLIPGTPGHHAASALSLGRLPTSAMWSAGQLHSAALIVAVGRRMGVPHRGLVIAVATAMQESSLTNTPYGDTAGPDSAGLFQQRPSQGWGSRAQVMDPVYATTTFYRRMLAVPGWRDLPLTVVAQAVQHSAYPGAYAKHEASATALVAAIERGKR